MGLCVCVVVGGGVCCMVGIAVGASVGGSTTAIGDTTNPVAEAIVV